MPGVNYVGGVRRCYSNTDCIDECVIRISDQLDWLSAAIDSRLLVLNSSLIRLSTSYMQFVARSECIKTVADL